MVITQDFDEYKQYIEAFSTETYANITITSGNKTYYGATLAVRIKDVSYLITEALKKVDGSIEELHIALGFDGDNLVNAIMPSDRIHALNSIGVNITSYLPGTMIDELWGYMLVHYNRLNGSIEQ